MTTTPEISNTAPAGIPTAIGPPSNSNFSPDNNGSQIHNSEYQNSYQWKLPMIAVARPKERTKSEYQREFTWKGNPSLSSSVNNINNSNAPTPTPPVDNNLSRPPSSALNIRSETPAKTPEPPKLIDELITSTSNTNSSIIINSNSSNSSTITPNNKPAESKYNGKFMAEPEDFSVAAERFMRKTAGITTNTCDHNNSWKGTLRTEQKESILASSLDDQTKKILALEANRLSKKSRSYSMYSLRDQLKTAEAAEELSSPMTSEYKREFVDWKEYGHQVREESIPKRKETESKLRRRGSWSATSLPEPLKWLGKLNIGEKNTSSSTKLQSTITDSKSIRGVSYNNSRLIPQRPSTSAEFRDYDDYEFNDKFDSKYNNSSNNNNDKRLSRDKYYNSFNRDTKYDNYYKTDSEYRNKSYDDRSHYYDDSRRETQQQQRQHDYDPRYRNRVSQLIDEDKYSERGSQSGSEFDRYSDRGSQFGEHDQYSNHSRNTSYSSQASSLHNKSVTPGLREELLSHPHSSSMHPPPSYIDNLQTRSNYSSSSSVSTPSLPSTPQEYYPNDSRLRKTHMTENSKEDLYMTPSTGYKDHYQSYNNNNPSRNGFYIDDDVPLEMNGRYSSKRSSTPVQLPSPLDNNRISSSSQRGRQLYATPGRSPLASMPHSTVDTSYSPARSPSPTDDGYRKYHQRGISTPIQGYTSRPESRAGSVSSHGTSIEEESVVLTDILRAADTDLLKSLNVQMSVFRTAREEVTPKIGAKPAITTTAKSGTAKTASKNSTSKTGKSSNSKTMRTAGLPTSGLTSLASKRSSLINGKTSLKNKTSTTSPTTNKGHKTSSSASSISSTSSTPSFMFERSNPMPFRNPTSFSDAREALNRARVQVGQMLDLVSNGSFEM
ncbi:7724_t:CDS:2 [Ambispora gerdemannii]|uniref:7724_t:CDS:1 n=1 Tax=Ambispora gerdemannii TaxID=144530 RepID=A0A9N9BKC3_9GLOM|nr:7724_t:CDS:2 [Ambispora gerdemannii]